MLYDQAFILGVGNFNFLVIFYRRNRSNEHRRGEINLKKSSFTAERAIFTYAELYAFGKSENLIKEGIFPEDSSHVTVLVNTNLARLFKDCPLSNENFNVLKAKYISNLRRIVDLKTHKKQISDTNPIIELTAAPVDFNLIDNAASGDEGRKKHIKNLARSLKNFLQVSVNQSK